MPSICSNTLLKNSADFIEPCLNSILPYVDRAIVSVDKASADGTIEIMKRMANENPKIDLDFYEIEDPNIDLPRQRDFQLQKTTEDWIWIVDDDEFYLPEHAQRLKDLMDKDDKYDAYAMRAWFVIDEKHYHPYRGLHRMERIFRNKPTLNWKGIWSKEAIHDGDYWVSLNNKGNYIQDTICQFGSDIQYIHLSFLKKYTWRTAFGKKKFHYPTISKEAIINYPVFPKEIQQILKQCLK